MNAPNDKNGKTICKGSYVKFENKLWEAVAALGLPERPVWLEPRAGNESPAQWAYSTEIEVTDLQQLNFEL
jgi:hypothetical protein